jgi:hypothetical protein
LCGTANIILFTKIKKLFDANFQNPAEISTYFVNMDVFISLQRIIQGYLQDLFAGLKEKSCLLMKFASILTIKALFNSF